MTGDFRDSPPFPRASARTLADGQLHVNLRRATKTIREKRERLVGEMEDFEEFRVAAAGIKDDALGRLDELLEELEANVTAAGGHVHFARDAAEANRIVVGLVEKTGAKQVVKVKSMTTVEIRLNEALSSAGIEATETDLAELIVQLGEDLPSHIVVPAIHRNRTEIRSIFLEHMKEHGLGAPEGLSNEPADLASAARAHLRDRFLHAKVAISGANYAVAESGALVVVESEGNGRMCLTLPETLISVVGIEKVIGRFSDLKVFFQLLARSATGERMSPYTSVWNGVTAGDGPSQFHLVLLDNGRSASLADRVGRQALRCIRSRRASMSARSTNASVDTPTARFTRDRWCRHRAPAERGRHRPGGGCAALCLHAVRRLLRGLPRPHRHPSPARAPAGTRSRSQARRRGRASRGSQWRARVWSFPRPVVSTWPSVSPGA